MAKIPRFQPPPEPARLHADVARLVANPTLSPSVAFVRDVDLAQAHRLKRRKRIRWLRFGGQDMSHTEDVRNLVRARHLRRRKAA